MNYRTADQRSACYHPDRAEITLRIYDTNSCGAGVSAGAWAGARLRGGFCWWRYLGKGRHPRLVIRSLGSGARALREYTCGANPIWRTV
eukprot:6190188-Pleurochrysis_carterae.AAC.1